MRSFLMFLLCLFLLRPVGRLSAQKLEEAVESESTLAPAKPEGEKGIKKGKEPSKEQKVKEVPEEKPVVSQHEIRIQGKSLKYTATVGMMPIKNADGEVEASIFFMAYTLASPANGGRRPLMFSFNGGPGSSSVWLHMGAIGPKRVKMLPWGGMPAPPFQLVDNEATWLDQSDLVFIDPVGTGYSRPAKKELGKKFWGVKGDIESVAEFIRLYLTRNERWNSPLFLVGESYGTTRASGLAGYLVDKGIALNGILLVSSVLNFQTLSFTRANDLPYVLYLPSYTATAWFHKKLSPDLQQQKLGGILPEVEQWATDAYAGALAKGTELAAVERQAMIDGLARYTGLSKSYVDQSNLRINQEHFCKELLHDEHRTIGRLDSRFTGMDASQVSEAPDYDPSEAAIRPPCSGRVGAF